MGLSELNPDLLELRAKTEAVTGSVNYRKAQHQLLSEQLATLKAREKTLLKSVELKTQTIAVFAQFTDTLWEETKKLVEELVTRGVQVVFGESLEFKVNFSTQRNNIVAEMHALDGGKERDLLTGDGGGLCDLVANLLRVSILLLKRPASDRIILLDEPIKGVDARHKPMVLEFLKALSESFGIQFIMVTHHPEFEGIGTNYVFGIVDGKTQVISRSVEGALAPAA